MTNLMWLLPSGIILLFLLVLIVAGVVGLVHAIRTSVKKHRRPPLIAMIGWGLSLLAIGLYIVTTQVIPSYGLSLYFWGHMHDFWAILTVCIAIALPLISTAFYIYDSYRLFNIIPSPTEADNVKEDGDEDEDEEEREERLIRYYELQAAKRQSMLGRIFAVVICLCLVGTLDGFVLYATHSVFVTSTDEITEVTSPRDGRVVYIERKSVKIDGYEGLSAELIMACAYERINPLCVAQLELVQNNENGGSSLNAFTIGNFTQDEIARIEWTEKGFLIPYEKQWVEYRFYGIDADNDS